MNKFKLLAPLPYPFSMGKRDFVLDKFISRESIHSIPFFVLSLCRHQADATYEREIDISLKFTDQDEFFKALSLGFTLAEGVHGEIEIDEIISVMLKAGIVSVD